MENKASKKIKILMGLILLLFLVPSGMDFVEGFSEGWKSVDREKLLVRGEGPHFQSFFVRLEPTGENETVKPVGNGHQFLAFRESGQLVMGEKMASVWWVMLLRIFFSLTALVTLVWFIILLFRFATKLSKRRVLAEENIRALRRIAYALGILSLSAYLVEVVEILWLRGHIALEGYRIALNTPPAALIVALILLVMTEVLKLGHKLQQEQDLTI